MRIQSSNDLGPVNLCVRMKDKAEGLSFSYPVEGVIYDNTGKLLVKVKFPDKSGFQIEQKPDKSALAFVLIEEGKRKYLAGGKIGGNDGVFVFQETVFPLHWEIKDSTGKTANFKIESMAATKPIPEKLKESIKSGEGEILPL